MLNKSIFRKTKTLTYLFVMMLLTLKLNAQQEVKVSISETALNEALDVIIESHGLNFGDYTGQWISEAWFVNVDDATIDVKTNNTISIQANIVATSVNIFDFINNYTVHADVQIDGTVQLINDQNGYKLEFTATDANLQRITSGSWDYLDDLFQVVAGIGLKLWVHKMPKIELTTGTKLLPDALTSYFTSSIPTLSSTDNEFVFSYNVAGDRRATVQNDLGGAYTIGNVEVLSGSNWLSYTSPHTEWWALNSNHQVRIPSATINYSNQTWRHDYWKWNVNQNYYSQINFTVSDDESYTAIFRPAQQITLQTNLEGTNTNGINITFQNQPVMTPYSDYAFMQPSSTSFGASQNLNYLSKDWFFIQWSDGSTLLNRYVSLTTPTTFTANYKGHSISNSGSGFNTNSQRKIVSTYDGKLHMVYESMNQVWYTISTDGGATWGEEKKVDNYYANTKSCSISQEQGIVFIVYQSDAPSIRVARYENGVRSWIADVYALSSYSYDTKPVIAAYSNEGALVVFKPTSTSPLRARNVRCSGSLCSIWTVGTDFQISYSTANSTNPSLVYNAQRIFLAFQEGTSEIRYAKLTAGIDYEYVHESSLVSSGSGYTNNQSPSISVQAENPVISWNAFNSSIPSAVVKRKTGSTWSSFNSFGNSTVRYTNNNSRRDVGEGSIIAWCNMYNDHKFVKLENGTYSSILSLPESGGNGQIQISNGAGFADMKAVIYKSPSSGIYPIQRVSYNFQTLQKMEADQNMNYGRTAIIQKEKKNFVYYLGGIKVDGEKVKFKDYIDTLKIENEEMMNNIMTTEVFYLTPKSEVEFGSSYYAFDNDEYKKVKENDAAFSIELVKLNGKELKGEFNPSKFELAEITDDESFYKLDCAKIEEGYYYFRVNNKVNGTAEYFVNDVMYEDTPELNKKSFAELQTAENAIPNNYSLDNNYPNPFNPTTTITFAIPQQEYVTLKVYDVLGKEVAALVNGIKSSGRHSVSFDGKDLASGIYFYTLKAGNFSQTNKMMLVK